jgi:hypothetical protein
MTISAFLGEGNRFWDYSYFYFEDRSLDANSALTMVASATLAPIEPLRVQASIRRGFTGSKVERLPSYWASKRNDHAVVIGVEYRPLKHTRVLGEWAQYTWGPTTTSAEMLQFDTRPIHKRGYYVTAEGRYPLTRGSGFGGSVTREEIDRADSLVKFLAAHQMFGVEEGRKDRMTVLRVFADLGEGVRLGFYRNLDSNPFPQASGIWPISGPKAYSGRSTDKWGLILRLQVP